PLPSLCPSVKPRSRELPTDPPKTRKARLLLRAPRRVRSAELSCYESGDPSTELFRFLRIFRLREDSDHGFRSRRPDEDPARAVQLVVDAVDLREEVVGERLCGNSHLFLRLPAAGA